jgi:hypothetical protein
VKLLCRAALAAGLMTTFGPAHPAHSQAQPSDMHPTLLSGSQLLSACTSAETVAAAVCTGSLISLSDALSAHGDPRAVTPSQLRGLVVRGLTADVAERRLGAGAHPEIVTGTVEQRQRVEMTLYMRSIRWAIWAMASGLGLWFTWLQIRNLDIAPVLNEKTPDLIWKGSLVIYFLSWVSGTNFDTDYQELVLVRLNRENTWPIQSVLALVALFVVAAALLWTVRPEIDAAGERNIKRFAVILCAFIVIDHAAWRYLIWFLQPATEASIAYYKNIRDFNGLEKLKVVVDQVQGNWKWWRLFCVGIPTSALIIGFAFSDSIRSAISKFVSSFLPGLSGPALTRLTSGLLVAMFVLSVECWHWAIRINTFFSLKLLDELEHQYEFLPK